MPVRKDTQKRFERRVQTFLNQNERLTNKEIKRMTVLLSQAENQIINDLQIVPHTEFDMFHLNQMKGQVDARLNELLPQLTAEVQSADKNVFDYSLDKADELMSASGIEVTPIFLDETVLEASQTLTGELISTVPKDVSKRIGNTLALDLTAGKSIGEVVIDLKQQFDISFESAERIARTEYMRTLSLTQEKRFQQIQELNPVYLKRWVHSGKIINGRQGHIEAEMVYTADPIPFNEAFMVRASLTDTKEAGQFPRDPAFSAKNTINCGCIHLLVPPELIQEVRRFFHVSKIIH